MNSEINKEKKRKLTYKLWWKEWVKVKWMKLIASSFYEEDKADPVKAQDVLLELQLPTYIIRSIPQQCLVHFEKRRGSFRSDDCCEWLRCLLHTQ